MPGLDGTGPRGEGPLTGRGLGRCINKESLKMPIFVNRFWFARGRGFGRRLGRGMMRRFGGAGNG